MKHILTIFLILMFVGCKGQEKEKEQEQSDNKEEVIVPPQKEWQVYREYDEQGNLIRYDSIYKYAYSNIQGDSVRVNLDSIMTSFKRYFDVHAPSKWNDGFAYFPKRDSLFMQDFFKKDYFFDHWEKEPSDINEMIRKMDSSRNSFLRKYYPGLLESKENKY